MKKIITLFAMIAFLGVVAAPSFATANYDKDPKAAKTETKKEDTKNTTGKNAKCCSNGASCKDKSACTGKKYEPAKK